MHIVGVLSRDSAVLTAVSRFRDPIGRFHLHPLQDGPTEAILAALVPLEFAGVLLVDEEFEAPAPQVSRSSLDAQQVGGIDTVTVAGGSLIGEYLGGRALGSLLSRSDWDARGAKVVLLGAGRRVASMARELSSLGAAQVVVLGHDRPTAERSAPGMAASTKVVTTAVNDPRHETYLEEADLLVRVDPALDVPDHVLGPHLCLLDLHADSISELRQRALNVGALTFNTSDYQAHRLSLGLSNILGTEIGSEGILALLHEASDR